MPIAAPTAIRMRLFLLSNLSSFHPLPPPSLPQSLSPAPLPSKLTLCTNSALSSCNTGIANIPSSTGEGDTNENNNCLSRALSNGFSIILAFGLLFSSPLPSLSSVSVNSTSSIQSSPSVSLLESSASCREEEEPETANSPKLLTNHSIVEEAWQIVYDSFLDTTTRHRWSPETWLGKKDDILGTSIQTRSKAHDIIRRMLASLGDPYTRFLTPAEGNSR